MKSKTLTSPVRVLSAFVGCSHCAFAQERRPVHFSGLINDYSPSLTSVKGSPWEMHGQWSMDVHPGWGTADFSADMTMSGFGKTAAGAVDPTQPLVNPHTHHIRLTNARITWDMTGCPAYATPSPNGLSDERHGQPVDGEWKQWRVRDESALIDAAGLCQRRARCPVLGHEFEHYAGVRGACDITFRASGHPWRRA